MQRLYITSPLQSEGQTVTLHSEQSHYVRNVLRGKPLDEFLVFNGIEGEWKARIKTLDRTGVCLSLVMQTRPQTPLPDLDYLFAPIKRGRLDYMVQKAVEMGAGRLRPVRTQHTQISRLNARRLKANMIEAAEQCGILALPALEPMQALGQVLDEWPEKNPGRVLIYCDEQGGSNPHPALSRRFDAESTIPPLACLVGPEGGFSQTERGRLSGCDFVVPVSLGPRILRADTAAVAALALIGLFANRQSSQSD